ncbi:MAG TPA: sugar ABC transporter substrate-binding protein [Actinophytocola sp.]|uniref:ABC transporter substrate-binding protein n=1 Tax=Actinophytocola sp. TaxID=1872138 RepID=UPI002DBE490B|nr:sugar ABC transporter substrate-binding protein [Actinophytocola sp.]HEU5470682.1 sugar ABC transporter substrate-binding protein [Actinophytocola sp.]
MTTRRHGKVAVALAAALALGISGCSSGSSSDGSTPAANGTQDAVDAALQQGGEITYWTWTPQAEEQVAAFQQEHPNVKVKLENVGTGNDHYTKLQNVIKAGSGAPDVAQVEYKAMPQFALTDALVDLNQYGFGAFEKDYTASTWASSKVGDGLYGLPQDSGPMALFYNKKVFDQYGITVPKTWDEYLAAARKLHAADPTKYLAADNGDSGFTTSMIWQAGGRPFNTEGKSVSINLADPGVKKWTAVWNQMLSEKLLAQIPPWNEEWYRALGNGTIASAPTGAWWPGVLASSVAEGAGQWAVAPMPTYDGQPVTAESGGSAQSVLKQSKNPALGAAFVRWLNNSRSSIKIFLDTGGFPATTADLGSAEFRDKPSEYFAGQQINQVLTAAADQVAKGWTYLPYQLYADSIYNDTVGKAYLAGTDINSGLMDWQKALVDYGNQQGFSVKAG